MREHSRRCGVLQCSDTGTLLPGMPLVSGSIGRKRHHRQPEVLDIADNGDELLEINRFGDIAVGMQAVGFQNVFFRLRSGENDHGKEFQVFVIVAGADISGKLSVQADNGHSMVDDPVVGAVVIAEAVLQDELFAVREGLAAG